MWTFRPSGTFAIIFLTQSDTYQIGLEQVYEELRCGLLTWRRRQPSSSSSSSSSSNNNRRRRRRRRRRKLALEQGKTGKAPHDILTILRASRQLVATYFSMLSFHLTVEASLISPPLALARNSVNKPKLLDCSSSFVKFQQGRIPTRNSAERLQVVCISVCVTKAIRKKSYLAIIAWSVVSWRPALVAHVFFAAPSAPAQFTISQPLCAVLD